MASFKQFLSPCAAILLTACASTTTDKPSISSVLLDTTGQKGRECIYTDQIQGYGLLGNNVVTIDARFGYFVATFRPGCLDMATSSAVNFGNGARQICGGLADEVSMGDSTCTIDKIFKFENRKAAFAAYETAAKIRSEAGKESPADTEPKK